MKMSILHYVTAIALMISSTYAISCSFNTDCDVGSTCVKDGGVYGYCMGGLNPGNSYDKDPATDLGGGGGWTCSFNTDCDPGYMCLKSGLQGVCIKR